MTCIYYLKRMNYEENYYFFTNNILLDCRMWLQQFGLHEFCLRHRVRTVSVQTAGCWQAVQRMQGKIRFSAVLYSAKIFNFVN